METEIEEPLSERDMRFLKRLECPVCLNGMHGHIFKCELGHNVCHKCVKDFRECPTCSKKITKTRNEAMEQLAHFVYFPCPFGCHKYILKKYFSKHYLDCDYKKLRCIMATSCKYVRTRLDMKDHIINYHTGNVWVNESHFGKWDGSHKSKVQAIIAHDSLFYLLVLNHPDSPFIHMGLKYIGPAKNAKNFKLNVNIFGNFDDRNMTFTEDCHKDSLTFAQIIDSGRCISIHRKKFETYRKDLDNCVYFKVHVIKLKKY